MGETVDLGLEKEIPVILLDCFWSPRDPRTGYPERMNGKLRSPVCTKTKEKILFGVTNAMRKVTKTRFGTHDKPGL